MSRPETLNRTSGMRNKIELNEKQNEKKKKNRERTKKKITRRMKKKLLLFENYMVALIYLWSLALIYLLLLLSSRDDGSRNSRPMRERMFLGYREWAITREIHFENKKKEKESEREKTNMSYVYKMVFQFTWGKRRWNWWN